ncbi:MAG: ShlB/FhaC/HecB family hemolysin secretion/activation protein [Pleurocapsa sp. MO_226.B13]|nr:ShlB/FhaC/HecB family hemolysin secretion/activation protein [Pleurocapsa sp. MO_226.B13]
MVQVSSHHYRLIWSSFILTSLILFPLPLLAQTSSPEIKTPPNIDRTLPRQPNSLPQESPSTPEQPELQFPQTSNLGSCQLSVERGEPYHSYRDRFFVRDILVEGNTVLEAEIEELIKDSEVKYRTATFTDLVCLRSRITDLYIQNGYVTSGAFLVNNQDLSKGIVQIQVVEGELEDIQISGLNHLTNGYVRSRLNLAATTPLNRANLETALQLLILDPVIATLSAELTAGKQAGSNILLIEVEEADPFTLTLGINNYRPPSIGEIQGSVNLNQINLFGFGDRLNAQYDFTEGLDLYNFGYSFPINGNNTTLGFRYDRSDSKITEEEFRDLDIESQTETVSFNLSQPLLRSPNKELNLGLSLDLRRRRTSLQNEPFAFPLSGQNGESNATVLRFSQDWVNRNAKSVWAARSQFNIGIDAFDATISDIEPDAKFFTWQGQFQWVQQLSSRNLLVARLGGQFTSEPLLSLEQFSLGGVNTLRGYQENQLITDSGFLGSLEFRIPITANPNTLQLIPFFDFGTGWNNEEPDPDPTTLASFGLGLNLSVASQLNLNLNYGVPLISVDNEGDSIQENGLHFSLSYQLF